MSWPFAECECADCLCGLVIEVCEETVKTLHAQRCEEPFSG